MPITPSTDENFLVPAGYVFFDREDASGALTGERYIGRTPGFSITIETPNNIQLYDADSPVEELLDQVVTRVVRSATVDCHNIDGENLADFFLGDDNEASTTAGSVTAEAVGPVTLGLWYQLGQDDTNPSGIRQIETVAVAASGGGTSYTEQTDYEIDLELARIRFLAGGSVSDGDSPEVDYDTTAQTWSRVVTSSSGARYAAVRLIADNTRGANRDIYAPQLLLAPSGELTLKDRENYQTVSFNLSFQRRQVGSVKRAALYADGRPVV